MARKSLRLVGRSPLLAGTALGLVTLAVAPAPAAEAARHLCINYPNQAAAQRAYRADPVGLAGLDADRDGIACETLPPPRDLVPVRLVRAAPAPAPAPAAPPAVTRLPRTGSGALPGEAIGGLALAAVAAGAAARALSRRAR
jgi:hypothetical protein